ncbi:MAG: hypothetical protein CM1200mP39_26340 [Dehalococcoidia bacterium]|nr:MAG: hypothetical protein CM1200mP39_26340 [Dehalococcoidia bacterium]
MNGTELDGRPIVVNEARDQAPRGGGAAAADIAAGWRGGGGRRERW